MKRNFRFYAILWAVLLVVFQVISFVSTGWLGQEKYTPAFWVGYGFITIAFLGQLLCAWLALKEEDRQKLFYNIPLMRISFSALIVCFIVGGACMLIPPLPYWVGILVCCIVLAIQVLSLVKAKTAADMVTQIDSNVAVKTQFMKQMTADAQVLMAKAGTSRDKTACKQVYEALRYCDHTSCAALHDIENRIQEHFQRFCQAVSNSTEDVPALAEEIVALIQERNIKNKLMK